MHRDEAWAIISKAEDRAADEIVRAYNGVLGFISKRVLSLAIDDMKPGLDVELLAEMDIVLNKGKKALAQLLQKTFLQYYRKAHSMWADFMPGDPVNSFDADGFSVGFARDASVYLLKAFDRVADSVRLYLDIMSEAKAQTASIQLFEDYSPGWRTDVEAGVADIIEEAYKPKAYYSVKTGQYLGDFVATRLDVQRDIMQLFRKSFGDIDFIEVNGRHYSLRYYVELVARCEMRKASARAAVNTAKEWGEDLVLFSEHGDKDGLCLPYEGQIFSISGQHPKYPPVRYPVIDTHPNCRHYLSPITAFMAKHWEKGGLND